MTSALRKKLLSLAIRGKLVPQDPADEPASVLLERIRAERESKESAAPRRGRGRRSSSDNPPCPKRETPTSAPTSVKDTVSKPPFPIPESWAWTTLENVLFSCSVGIVIRPTRYYTDANHGTPAFRNTNICMGKVDTTELVYLSESAAKENPRSVVHSGDVLIARSGSPGICCVVPTEYEGFGSVDILVARPDQRAIISEYLAIVVNANETQNLLRGMNRGVALSHVGVSSISSLPIPLPPISEQRDIVSRFEELSALCESINEESAILNDLATKTKSRILDLAIRGDLVPQNPVDEPASALLVRIRTTADKPPCPKSPANPPFPIPENWAWTTLGTVCDYGRCETVDASTVKDSTWSLDLEDIEKGTGRLLVRVRAGERSAAGARHSFRAGELLYSKLRTYLNKVLVADEDGICSSEILPLDFRGQVLPEYARCVLMSPMFLDYAARCGYGVKMPRLGTADGRNGPFPLPPLAEQRRIVAKVDEMLVTIDGMLG